ncbi:hypothetical protein ACV356_32960 [Pseudomonas aeruginosa]
MRLYSAILPLSAAVLLSACGSAPKKAKKKNKAEIDNDCMRNIRHVTGRGQ